MLKRESEVISGRNGLLKKETGGGKRHSCGKNGDEKGKGGGKSFAPNRQKGTINIYRECDDYPELMKAKQNDD